MKIRTLFFTIVITLSNYTYGQNEKVKINAINNVIQKTLRYPIEAATNKYYGTLVGGLAFNNEQKPEIIIINPLQECLNIEFKRIMKLLCDNYEFVGNDTLLWQIEFRMADLNYVLHTKNKPDGISDGIQVLSYGTVMHYSKNGVNKKMGEKIDLEEKDLSKVKKIMAKKKFKKAIPILNLMIQRNPYMPELYYHRATCYSNIAEHKLGCNDYEKITSFLKYEGLELNINNN